MKHDRAYYRWLLGTFTHDPERDYHVDYSCLCDQMYRKAYYYIIENDENRAGDGLYLREMYEMTPFARAGSIPQGPCSFLEFLIGVAIRLQEMLVDGETIPVYVYFWELANRLGLADYTDEVYFEDSTVFIVDSIMTDYMDRRYGRCGEGGLFPLNNPCRDQTKVEVWYQLNEYLLQNPDFFD